MGALIAAVMLVAIATLVLQVFDDGGRRWVAVASLLLSVGPIGLAAVRIIPNAIRLGSRSDDTRRQSELARSICKDHIFCVVCIVAFVALQLTAAMAG